MVETTTLHYGWTKPEIAHSASTWGGFLNNDLDSIDALVYANQQGIVPIGSITMFAGATAPANWLLCDGSSRDTTAYAGLFAVLGYAYGGSGPNFNLPNLAQKFPMGAGTLAATGGEATHTLTAAEMPTHAHNASQAAHTHPGSYQDAHVHPDPGHAHSASQDPHNHTYAHTDTGHAGVANGGSFAGVFTDTTSTAQPTVYVGASGVGLGAAQPALHIDTQQPAITVASAGSGTAHNNLPPYLTVNFIIRAT